MYQRRRADAGSAERFELSLWRGAYATRMVRLYSSFLCLGSEGGCNHQGSRVQLSLRALHLKSLCPLLVLCLAGRGRQRSCATDSIEACPLGWEPEVVRETRGGTERTMGVSLPNVRIAALCLLIWRGRFPTSRAVAVTLWRSPSGATEDRNVHGDRVVDAHPPWRSPSGATEDRNQDLYGWAGHLRWWRSPSGATEDRNPPAWWRGARGSGWRSPSGATEDRNVATDS